MFAEGIDGTSHMSKSIAPGLSPWSLIVVNPSFTGEEVKNSALVVPRSMILGLCISGIFTIGISIAILFSIGDVVAVLTSPTKFPITEVFYVATQSKAATTVMVAALISTLVFATFGLLAAASRMAWAFARDKGFPFSQYIAHVSTIRLA